MGGGAEPKMFDFEEPLFPSRFRRRIANWRERGEIIQDMQDGRFTVAETIWRLEQHAKPGGGERRHVFSCRNGFLTCAQAHCPYEFDRNIRPLVPLTPTPGDLE